MKRALVALAILAALPLLAADVEQFLLPVSPSVVHCGYESRYGAITLEGLGTAGAPEPLPIK